MTEEIGLKLPRKRNFCDNISFQVSNGLNTIFYRIGLTVATHPWNTIICSILLVVCCSVGLLAFHKEKNPLKLWIPQDSKFIKDTKWLTDSFEDGYRKQNILLVDDNVLRPEVLRKLAILSKKIMNTTATMSNGTVIGWKDVCFRIPIIAELTRKPSSQQRRKRQSFDFDDDLFDEELTEKPVVMKPFNPSVDLNPIVYCGIIDNLPMGCLMANLLEIWNFDENVIGNLTEADIINAVNLITRSASSGHESDFVGLLGGTVRNSSGHIVSATALMSHWMLYLNFSNIDHDKTGNEAGTEDWASEEALVWENNLLETLERLKNELFSNETEMFYEAARSFGDISSATMFQYMDKLMIGGFLMFTYLLIILSKFNWVEFRLILGSMGLLSIGMAFVSAVGICSIMGVSYGPVHTSLPFLMMGLGVDDIFVMMACWRQIQVNHYRNSIPEKIALMLQHSGSSVTVTSFTDVVAFAIGASTMLPSLQSFCIYAAVGVLFIYILAITFVVAVFTLDERRIAQNRHPIFPWMTRKDGNKEPVCNAKIGNRMLKIVFKFILTKPGKIIILTSVLSLTAFSTHNLFQLKQKFDQSWFIPKTTYLYNYLYNQQKYYPDAGLEAGIFMGRLNYTAELPKLCAVSELLKNQTDLVYDVDSWIDPFQKFVEMYFEKDVCSGSLSDAEFSLSKFLFSSSGGKYQANFKFDKNLKCGQAIPQTKISSIPFHYKKFDERNVYVPAMHAIDDLVWQMNFSSGDGVNTVWAKVYANWITDEVIDVELIRNVSLALVSVMVCTVILIANVSICFYIFVTVLLTLIFMLVILFGLFHGIVFLPVVLSVIGPQPYEICESRPKSTDTVASLKRKRNIDVMEMDVNELRHLRPTNGIEKTSLH